MQKARFKRISKRRAWPGDLIIFLRNGHVGIVIGKGKFVHASNPRTDVRIDSYTRGYWRRHISGVGRVIVSR